MMSYVYIRVKNLCTERTYKKKESKVIVVRSERRWQGGLVVKDTEKQTCSIVLSQSCD